MPWFKLQVQDNPDDPESWHDVRDAGGNVLKFDDERIARERLESLYPVEVKLERYSGPKTTRVVRILEGTHDSRPMPK